MSTYTWRHASWLRNWDHTVVGVRATKTWGGGQWSWWLTTAQLQDGRLLESEGLVWAGEPRFRVASYYVSTVLEQILQIK